MTRPRLIGLHETAVGVRETVVVRCDQVPRNESGGGGGEIRGSLGGVCREFMRDVSGVCEGVVRRSLGGNIGGDWESLGSCLGEMLGGLGR